MPQLITKLPEGKNPVICIYFEKEWDTQKTNEDLVAKFAKDVYQVRLMPIADGTMNLMVISNDNQRLYKHLAYDYFKLQWWLNYTKGGVAFSFCHIIVEKDKHKLVRIVQRQKPFVLKVSGYTLADEEQLSL